MSKLSSDSHNSESEGPGDSARPTLPETLLASRKASYFRLGSEGMQAKVDYDTPASPPPAPMPTTLTVSRPAREAASWRPLALEIGCSPCPAYTLKTPHLGQGQLKPQRARYRQASQSSICLTNVLQILCVYYRTYALTFTFTAGRSLLRCTFSC